MSDYPHSHGGSFEGPSLATSPDLSYQVGVLIRPSDNGASVHKRTLPDGNWSSHTFTGTAAAKLVLPVPNDGHNWFSCGIDGLGKIHVFGNMHAYFDETRYVQSTNANDITAWTDGSLPGLNAGYRLTYPRIVPLNDGTLTLWMRAYGGSGGGDYHWWSRGPTATVWTHRGLLWGNNASTTPDYSAYPTSHHVEPPTSPHNPGRIHVAWVWRESANVEDGNLFPSYMYSDNGGTQWRAADDTILTPPIFPTNNPACQTGLLGGGAPIVNGGGLCVDASGYPVFTIARVGNFTDHDLARWNGTAWTITSSIQTNLPKPEGQTDPLRSRPNLFLWRGNIHALVTDGAGRVSIYDLDDQTLKGKFGRVGRPAAGMGSWESNFDQVTFRDRGLIQFFLPDGDKPRVFTWGRRGVLRAAAGSTSTQAG